MICEAEQAAKSQTQIEPAVIVVPPSPPVPPTAVAPPASVPTKRATRSRAPPAPQQKPLSIPPLILKVPSVSPVKAPAEPVAATTPIHDEPVTSSVRDSPDSVTSIPVVKVPVASHVMESSPEEDEPDVIFPVKPPPTRRTGRRGAKSPIATTNPPAVPKTTRQSRKVAAAAVSQPTPSPPEPAPEIHVSRPPIKSYSRKRKIGTTEPAPIPTETAAAEPMELGNNNLSAGEPPTVESVVAELEPSTTDDFAAPPMDLSKSTTATEEEDSVPKLVISKKKGSIFKSRATESTASGPESTKAKRHQLYRHKWDHDADNTDENPSKSDGAAIGGTATTKPLSSSGFTDDFDDDRLNYSVGALTKVNRPRTSPSDFRMENDPFSDDCESSSVTSVHCSSRAKPFYTVVRNVKKAHQMQEIGEFQEMDDDVHYILDALQTHNPLSTRCLSAIQLASKCMTPAFRMHVRAHGIVQSFFKALEDAQNNQSLALCTATIMFVLNQDYSNMDLDRDSLCLMLNLLQSDATHHSALDDCSLTQEQLARIRDKVTEICTVIKPQGKAVFLSPDNITVGTLAMETLLSLTSKRAGEWFKDELRNLGGLEKILSTVCECIELIAGSDYATGWTSPLLDQMRKLMRCLTVLENVTSQNDENQAYTLEYRDGLIADLMLRFYQLCALQVELYPTDQSAPKDSTGAVLYEVLNPTLKVLINLTGSDAGKTVIGAKVCVYQTSLRLMFNADHCVLEPDIICVFILSLLVSLTTQKSNGQLIMESRTPAGVGKEYDPDSAIKAIIHFFNKRQGMAEQVDRKTDEMLDNKTKAEPTEKSGVVVVVDALVKNSRTHMEHTIAASYVSLLVGQLIIDSKPYQIQVRKLLHNHSFAPMAAALEKYYELMNLTATSEAATVAHMKQTRRIIQCLEQCDKHSGGDQPDTFDDTDDDFEPAPVLRRMDGGPQQYRSMRNNTAAGGSSTPSTYSSSSRSGR